MSAHPMRVLAMAASVPALSACGGGAGGIISTPAPIAAPAPSPAPSPTPTPAAFTPVPAAIFPSVAVKSVDTNFGWSWHDADAAPKEPLKISYDASSGEYQITLPDGRTGTLMQSGQAYSEGSLPVHATVGASSTVNVSGSALQSSPSGFFPTVVRYSYVSLLDWIAFQGTGTNIQYTDAGLTVAAQRTPAPLTGTASYAVYARANYPGTTDPSAAGTGSFTMDFAANTLAGSFRLYDISFGGVGSHSDYELRAGQITRAAGADGFQAKLAVIAQPPATNPIPAGIAADLQGGFAGPAAAEIFGKFRAPVFSGDRGEWQGAGGVFVGKK